jgi:hypothetical protein
MPACKEPQNFNYGVIFQMCAESDLCPSLKGESGGYCLQKRPNPSREKGWAKLFGFYEVFPWHLYTRRTG